MLILIENQIKHNLRFMVVLKFNFGFIMYGKLKFMLSVCLNKKI